MNVGKKGGEEETKQERTKRRKNERRKNERRKKKQENVQTKVHSIFPFDLTPLTCKQGQLHTIYQGQATDLYNKIDGLHAHSPLSVTR